MFDMRDFSGNEMSDTYLDSFFDILDGKVKYSDYGKKKRGRKPGYKHTKETKEKIAQQMRGRVKDEETKNKISESLRGREKSPETRAKISESKRDPDNTVPGDLLDFYSGSKRERDSRDFVPMDRIILRIIRKTRGRNKNGRPWHPREEEQKATNCTN